MTFGEFVKSKRIELRKTLREFCIEYKLDPQYISRLERGRNSAPRNDFLLGVLASYLKLNELDRQEFIRLAYIDKPPKPITDEEFAQQCLPLLLHLTKCDPEDIKRLIGWLKEKM